jgi:hypothetical protein
MASGRCKMIPQSEVTSIKNQDLALTLLLCRIEMSRWTKKDTLGILSLCPALYYALMLITFNVITPEIFVPYFNDHVILGYIFFFSALLIILTGLGMTIYCIIHALRSDDFTSLKKFFWVIGLFFFQLPCTTVYYYLYIWNETS